MIQQPQSADEYYAYGTPQQGKYWGGYQYISLKDVLDEVLLDKVDSDSILKNTRRSKLLMLARDGIQTLNQELKTNIRAIEMELSNTLFIPLPQDYVDWVRISVVGEDFKLKPLRINENIPTYTGYLQDNNYQILFDNNGDVLTANSANAYNKPYSSYDFDKSCYSQYYSCVNNSSQLSYGEAKVDNVQGRVVFSSNLANRLIVFEYASDGLQNDLKGEDIKIHKHSKQALKAFIYARAIAHKKHVNRGEKKDAWNYYKGLKHKALVASQDFTMRDVSEIIDKNAI